jgi:hypothetical protein
MGQAGGSMPKPTGLTANKVKDLARRGAELAIKELRAEIIAIERTFPELALPRRRRALRRSLHAATTRTRRLSQEARRAISDRMTRYWAARRKAKARIK